MELLNNKSIEEITEKLLELSKDMDYMDYEEEQENIKRDLENMLYYLKACAENNYNHDYFRTFYNILQNI